MRNEKIGVVALALLLAACGSTTQQRAATGGLTGLGIGALAGGPVGALIGGAVGSVAGWITPEGADTLALSVLRPTRTASAGSSNAGAAGSSVAPSSGSGAGSTANAMRPAASEQAASLQVSPELVKHIQTVLKDQGFYGGPIDGIVGRQTHAALAAYQEREGLAHSSVLDLPTLQALAGAGTEASGSEAPAARAPAPSSDSGAPEAESAPATGAAARTDIPAKNPAPTERR